MEENKKNNNEPKAIIAPSLLNSDFALLSQTAKDMKNAGADWLHMDVMVFFS